MNQDLFDFKKYKTNIYWGKHLIIARERELEDAKKNLVDYIAWWDKFISYCHTGK